jgi:hypothetical protein
MGLRSPQIGFHPLWHDGGPHKVKTATRFSHRLTPTYQSDRMSGLLPEATKRLPDRGRCSSSIRVSPTSLRRAQRTPLDVPRSTGQPLNEWLVRFLSRTGEVRFTGCDCLSMIVMRATSGRAFFGARFEAARFTETTAAIRYPIPDHATLHTALVRKLNVR